MRSLIGEFIDSVDRVVALGHAFDPKGSLLLEFYSWWEQYLVEPNHLTVATETDTLSCRS